MLLVCLMNSLPGCMTWRFILKKIKQVKSNNSDNTIKKKPKNQEPKCFNSVIFINKTDIKCCYT